MSVSDKVRELPGLLRADDGRQSKRDTQPRTFIRANSETGADSHASRRAMDSPSEVCDAPTLLLADDDARLCSVLQRALEEKGYKVAVAHGYGSALAAAAEDPPAYAVIDQKLQGGSGLRLMEKMLNLRADMRVVVVTSYGSIASAIEAVKHGAHNYLTKPADAEDIVAALSRDSAISPAPHYGKPLSVYRLAWEHINRVMLRTNGNITAAARELGIHRRTLQRKLNAKYPVRN